VIDHARKRGFKEIGGSQTTPSHSGSKALAVGMLMAALDRPDFALVLVEYLASVQTLEFRWKTAISRHFWGRSARLPGGNPGSACRCSNKR
jgi:hypothetical protein